MTSIHITRNQMLLNPIHTSSFKKSPKIYCIHHLYAPSHDALVPIIPKDHNAFLSPLPPQGLQRESFEKYLRGRKKQVPQNMNTFILPGTPHEHRKGTFYLCSSNEMDDLERVLFQTSSALVNSAFSHQQIYLHIIINPLKPTRKPTREPTRNQS